MHAKRQKFLESNWALCLVECQLFRDRKDVPDAVGYIVASGVVWYRSTFMQLTRAFEVGVAWVDPRKICARMVVILRLYVVVISSQSHMSDYSCCERIMERDNHFIRWKVLCTFLLLHVSLATYTSPWPYLQIYPPVNETDSRTPLYFALMLSFGGDYTSIGALPGVQIALDYINSEPSILPGYTLHYTLTDSQVKQISLCCNYNLHLVWRNFGVFS